MGVGEGAPNLFAPNLTGATRQPRRRIMRPASQVRHRAMRQAQAGFHAAQLRSIQSPGARRLAVTLARRVHRQRRGRGS